MTKKKILELIGKGEAFVDVENDMMTVYHDVTEDRYYIEDEDGFHRATLIAEVRYTTECEPNEYDLLCGNFEGINDFDYTCEFDNPIETSGLYIFRYGYFKIIHSNKEDRVTMLIDLTE